MSAIQQDHSGSGDNVGGDKHVHNYHFGSEAPAHLSGVTFLSSVPILLENVVIGRESESAFLASSIESENARVCITGIRGIGKTSVIRHVVNSHLSDFKYVAWLNFGNDNIKAEQIIASQIRIPASDSYLLKLNRVPTLNEITTYFVGLTGEKILVIENITSFHIADISRFAARLVGWKIIVSSHVSINGLNGFIAKRIAALSVSHSQELFLKHYSYHDTNLINRLIKKVGYHTLTIEIIAKTCKYWQKDYPIEELLQKIENSGLQELEDFTGDDINVDHSVEEVEGLIPYYDLLFDFKNLETKIEKELLINLAVLLPNSWTEDIIKDTIGISSDREDIKKLKTTIKKFNNMGLIYLEDGHIEMHQTVQYFVRYKFKPTSDDCRHLIQLLQDLVVSNNKFKPVENLAILPHAENIITILNEDNSPALASLELAVAMSFRIISLYDRALAHIEHITDRNKDLLNSSINPHFVWEFNMQKGHIYKHGFFKDWFKVGLECFTKAQTLSTRIFGKKSEQLANCYGETAILYIKKKDVINAKKYLDKAYLIHKKQEENYGINIAMYYSHLGDIERINKRPNNAILQFKKAESVFSKYPPQADSTSDRRFVALVNYKLAQAMIIRGTDVDFELAKSHLEFAKNEYLSLFGDIHENLIEVERLFGELAIHYGDFINALKCIDKQTFISNSLQQDFNQHEESFRWQLDRLYLNPAVEDYLLAIEPHKIENMKWHYRQLGTIYVARLHHISYESPSELSRWMHETNTSRSDYLAFMKSMVSKAKHYFTLSEDFDDIERLNFHFPDL
ncbi:tetratricopeptide repeat protein [Dyadobacter sp. CY347]|uniref:tetratricopeptide repeat protein n=1 Tax=Dyadobacter sp. CY347 TaxID=2909336 RepID=UPI001F2BD37B|nr:tetratricopeptide repeat protein [Dyadobacter sp. CY347]MCF2491515.1 ATP-binding protein [Dyadobacter sp. CY347]